MGADGEVVPSLRMTALPAPQSSPQTTNADLAPITRKSPLRIEQAANDSTPHEEISARPVTPNLQRLTTPTGSSYFSGILGGKRYKSEGLADSPRFNGKAAESRGLDGLGLGNNDESALIETQKGQSTGENTPPTGRRSVQFARSATDHFGDPPSRSRSWDAEEKQPNSKDRNKSSLFSKIRTFGTSSGSPSHVRAQSTFTVGGDLIDERFPAAHFSRGFEMDGSSSLLDGSEIDADAEQSTGEDSVRGSPLRQRRRKSRRPLNENIQTAPTTPKAPSRRNSRSNPLSSSSIQQNDRFRPSFLTRRATMTDATVDNQGVSEDEGRNRLGRGSPWRRGTSWVYGPRGLGHHGNHNLGHQTPGEERRPSNFRRFTGLGGPTDGAEAVSPFSPWKLTRGDRASTLSAARWRQLKAGLNIGRRRKDNTIDHAKSAELLAELTAGVPAALILASMFQRDEHGNKRIPILLEQLKVRFVDSQVDSKSGDRHMVFKIELEYGNGPTRMKWVIQRTLRDFANLHARYKLHIGAQKYIQLRPDDARTKLPHFPKSAFPYLRGMRGGLRGLDSDSDGEEGDGTGPSGGEASLTERPNRKKTRRPSANTIRRASTGLASPPGGEVSGVPAGGSGAAARREPYPERQRKKLEVYLQKMIRYLIFRPESNRLCKFLELSAIGVRLAAEGGYHGKEGLLIIQSAKGIDFRRVWSPSMLKDRHSLKWFAVRHSYIVCVDSPEEMNIYDVFMVDSNFQIQMKKKRLRDQNPLDFAKSATNSASHPQHHSLKLWNSERKLKLLAKNERLIQQFEDSIRTMVENSAWAKPNRYGSFAPVRQKVFAQWLVDGRDYMWNVSRAISKAKDVIYIHDWWLSPELYMRRPAAISQKWRLDRLLQRKAQEGVKVFVILYRNINSAIPIDSEYTKFSLLDLHPNIFVQRSPNQIRQNTFFWAHHEKICVVDHSIAFVGGIDLCFGRWDTPEHSVVDDKLTGFELSEQPKDADHCQLWPGKDYSNPRVQDFYGLDKPYEEMYDRSKIPRMPWHDISMQVVGQPARDLTRHFVQRWNYILRQRKPTRPTPFLLPPPDFNPGELVALGLDGSCEVQILRSTGLWSIGTPDQTEHSIMNAYVKMIEQSEHFVYIENQFFITSCEVEGKRIENHIGDALVERIIRASQQDEAWRAVILIPLIPGFQNTVDQQDGTSIRLIMQCQFRSICRGESSIFGRLRAEGIEPEDYIQFYSLRSWGKIGPNKQIVTEQLYIHAKCMVVDDRIAIIGSANINERSMLGPRDSECAAVVRDTDMIWSTMSGEPYQVGRFTHALRMRLMREHLGIDVDEVGEDELSEDRSQTGQWEDDMDRFHGEGASGDASEGNLKTDNQRQADLQMRTENMFSFNHEVDREQSDNPNTMNNKNRSRDSKVTENEEPRNDVTGLGSDNLEEQPHRVEPAGGTPERQGALLTTPEANHTSRRRLSGSDHHTSLNRSPSRATEHNGTGDIAAYPTFVRKTTEQLGLTQLSQLPALPKLDDTDIGGPSALSGVCQDNSDRLNPLLDDMRRPVVDKDCMRDPLNDSFHLDIWHTVADNNTRLFRMVFRCMPDNEVKSWKEYKEYAAYAERFSQSQGDGKSRDRIQQETPGSSGPPGQTNASEKVRMLGSIGEKVADVDSKLETLGEKLALTFSSTENNQSGDFPLGKIEEWAQDANKQQALRQEKEAEGRTAAASPRQPSPSSSTVNDEKAATAQRDGLNDFTPLKPSTATLDPEALHKRESPNSATYSDVGQRRRRRTTTRSSRREFRASDDILGPAEAEQLMQMTQGHLVMWPTEWLASFIFSKNKIANDFSQATERRARRELALQHRWLGAFGNLVRFSLTSPCHRRT